MLRIVFVAVDRADDERSVTRSHTHQGARTRPADAAHYLRALKRRSLGPLAPEPAARALLA